MDLDVYKILHLFGLILLFQSLGASLYQSFAGSEPEDGGSKKMLMMMHGAGLFLMLLGGFGMLAKLEIGFPFPAWTWVKLAVWVLLGSTPILIRKGPSVSRMWWSLSIFFGLTAAYMGLFKPF